MMKKYFRTALVGVGCALLGLSSVGCSGNDTEDTPNKSFVEVSKNVSVEKFLEGNAQIYLRGMANGMSQIIICADKGADVPAGTTSGTVSGTVQMLGASNTNLLYTAQLTVEKTVAGTDLTIVFKDLQTGSSYPYDNGTLLTMRMLLRVADPGSVGENGSRPMLLEALLHLDTSTGLAVADGMGGCSTGAGQTAWYDSLGEYYSDQTGYNATEWAQFCLQATYDCVQAKDVEPTTPAP